MTTEVFDMIVIGAGPAGQKAAVQAAKAGKRALVVERAEKPGGECVRRGTIPSKALREQAQQLVSFKRRNAIVGMQMKPGDAHLTGHLRRATEVMAVHAATADRQLTRNGVARVRGQARFIDPRTIEIVEVGGARRRAQAARILIATGSRPRTPPGIPVDHEHIFDSDSILELPYLPQSLAVLGGGVIACEYASIFQALGSHVTTIDKADRPLGFLDAELSQIFVENLKKGGGRTVAGANIDRVEFDGVSAVHVHTSRGDFVAEKVLVALGRAACVDGLSLERAGVRLDPRGFIEVDENLCAAPGIYAAGDVIGPPALASTSMEQGRRAARHALGLPAVAGFDVVPVGVYTIPELSSVGASEEEARKRYGDVIVGRASTSEIARGIISGQTDGMLKIVADAHGVQLLGVQVAGDGAAELVHVGQLAMMGGLCVEDLVDHVFNFPTMAEAFRVAALDVLGQRDKRATVGARGNASFQAVAFASSR